MEEWRFIIGSGFPLLEESARRCTEVPTYPSCAVCVYFWHSSHLSAQSKHPISTATSSGRHRDVFARPQSATHYVECITDILFARAERDPERQEGESPIRPDTILRDFNPARGR